MSEQLKSVIEAAWEARDQVSAATRGEVREAVDAALSGLDNGSFRVAEKGAGGWTVNQWLKKAVLLSFRLNDMGLIAGGPGLTTHWWDKVPSKFEGWSEADFRKAGFRAVPGSRTEEHTSELQSLMSNSYAVFCLQKKTNTNTH